MSDIDLFDADAPPTTGPLAGLLFATVSNVEDPDKLGRVKVLLPTLSGTVESTWARVLQPGAGAKSGHYWPLEERDEVIVGFVGGHPELPVVMGALWNAKNIAAIPEAKRRLHRVLGSQSGHLLRLDDSAGAEKIELVAAKGENSITLDVAGGKVQITAKTELEIKVGADIVVSMKAGKVEIKCAELAITATAQAKIASAALTLEGSASLAINGNDPSNGVSINNGALVVT